jgi:hypothetical protein
MKAMPMLFKCNLSIKANDDNGDVDNGDDDNGNDDITFDSTRLVVSVANIDIVYFYKLQILPAATQQV